MQASFLAEPPPIYDPTRPTTVISVRGVNSPAARLALTSDPSFLYCGRAFAGWPGSIWGNPIKPASRAAHDVAACVAEFERRLRAMIHQLDCLRRATDPDLIEALTPTRFDRTWPMMAKRIGELRGRKLGCYCGRWEPGDKQLVCHARVLAEIANELPKENQ